MEWDMALDACILGVSLFATTKLGDTLNEHANFQNFIVAFITLFRASTGEAWNEIMHELASSQVVMYRQGDWCSPSDLFDTDHKYEVLKEKCLIENPNSCDGKESPASEVVDVCVKANPWWCDWPPSRATTKGSAPGDHGVTVDDQG
eukprot:Skav212869  [mRNA]  locus=scaffold151:59022:64713:- [translate_table: standard]